MQMLKLLPIIVTILLGSLLVGYIAIAFRIRKKGISNQGAGKLRLIRKTHILLAFLDTVLFIGVFLFSQVNFENAVFGWAIGMLVFALSYLINYANIIVVDGMMARYRKP